MWNRTVIGVLAAASMAVIALAGSASAQTTQAAATMPSDAELLEGLEALLKTVGEAQLDLGLDGLTEAKARTLALRRAIGDYSQELRKRVVDEQGQKLLERDLVSLRNDVSPRLSGRIIRVGSDMQIKNLADAQPLLQPGDLVLLGSGTFTLAMFRDSAPLNDVAIVGQGAMKTAIKVPRGGTIGKASRLMLEGLRIDCREEAVAEIRDGSGGIILRDCELFNYNNGHGGAYGLNADSGVVWIERCLFEGASGSMKPEHGLGTAMRLSSQAMLVARDCQFVDNRDILGGGIPAVFDRCTVLQALGEGDLLTPSSQARVWLRESDSIIDERSRDSNGVLPLVHACDDSVFVEHVLDQVKPIDEESKRLARDLALHRRLPYWIGLVHHHDARVRMLAKSQLEKIMDLKVSLPTQPPADGERLADLGAWVEIEREYGRLMDWFEANRGKLEWNPAIGRYDIVEGPSP